MDVHSIQRSFTKIASLLSLGLACVLLQACTERMVYTEVTANDSVSGNVFVLATNQTTPVAISNVYGPARPCGHLSDGRLVVTIQSQYNGMEIYLADPSTGQVLDRVMGTLNDERCVFVTPDNYIIYEVIGPDWAGHDVNAIKVGTVFPIPIANNTADEYFLGYSPDKHVIFARHAPQGFNYDIMSAPISGGTEVMLAQVFPPNTQAPLFKGITSDNRVIFSENVEYQQGSTSVNIYSVKTDGTGKTIVAKNAPYAEEFCAIASDNRIFFTERSTGTVNGQSVTRGDLFSVNPDGSNRLLLSKGASYNDTCRGLTSDNRVIFSRAADSDYRSEGPTSLYSVVADGQSQPILLADSKSTPYGGGSTTNYFERMTPNNRVLFRNVVKTPTSSGTSYTVTLNSIMPDGTVRTTLTDNINVVGAVTADDRVVYNAHVAANGPVAYSVFTVPAAGGAAPTLISAPSANLDYVNFVYITTSF